MSAPILKWAGGKSRLAPRVAEAFGRPCEGTYYEPFLGSASVFLHLRAHGLIERAVLSDVNEKLIKAYRALRDDADGVLRELEQLPRDDWSERYREVRDDFNAGPHSGAAHAARLFWLNRACFNGLYRENKSGGFNVHVGSYKALRLPDPERFREVAELLQGVTLYATRFERALDQAGPGDHVYCDPPYVGTFAAYSAAGFSEADQHALARAARGAASRGARVVLSNADLPAVRNELYPTEQGFEVVASLQVRRSISRGKRGKAAELLAAIGEVA